MEYNYEFFYLGKPVETPIGLVEFKKVEEYDKVAKYLAILKNTDKISILKLLMKSGNGELANVLSTEPLLDTLIVLKESVLYEQYVEALEYFLCKNIINQDDLVIYTDEELYEYLELIYHMNATSFPRRLTGNPEIDRYIQYEKQLANSKSGGMTIEAILSSVKVYMGLSMDELKNMTIYQLFADFYRVNQYQSFTVTSMYTMMDSKVKIIDWNKDVDILGTLSTKEKTLEQANKEGKAKFT